ncbi:MAG: hypothetical protein ACK4X1_07985 [Terricaulis sp.]
MPEINDTDPHAPPPMHHDRSGAVLRVVLLAAMLGAAGLGYAWYTQQPRTALVPEVIEEQRMADAGYQVAPEALPEAAPEALPPAPAPPERTAEPAVEPNAAPASEPVPEGAAGSM